MEFALIASVLSAICLALMVITDRLMVGDCYQGNPNQAWFVSSLAGSVFGLMLTGLVSAGAILLGKVGGAELLHAIGALLWWKGVAMIVVGGLGIQILLHYFRCFAQEAHSASIAAWLAATPIFVYAGMAVVTLFSEVGAVVATSFDPIWILGIVLATVGLVAFERLTEGKGAGVGKYRRELILMLMFNVAYIIGLRQILGQSHGSGKLTEVLALMPYYWIGFAVGIRVIFKSGEWHLFRLNWRKRIRYFIVPILFVEIIGMLVFWFEYLGLAELDPAYVSIITGANIFLVYILNLLLGKLRKKMVAGGIRRIYAGGVRFVAQKLPHPSENITHIGLELAAMLVTVLGVAIATPLIFR
jgi:hypothetical protein